MVYACYFGAGVGRVVRKVPGNSMMQHVMGYQSAILGYKLHCSGL